MIQGQSSGFGDRDPWPCQMLRFTPAPPWIALSHHASKQYFQESIVNIIQPAGFKIQKQKPCFLRCCPVTSSLCDGLLFQPAVFGLWSL